MMEAIQDIGELDNGARLIIAIIILIMTVILASLVRRMFNRFIQRSTDALNADSTNYRFMSHLIVATIYVAGIGFAISLIPVLKSISTSMLGAAGILAVAVGFASQEALANIISGLFIVIYKPYKISDRITVMNEIRGVIEDINLRHTIIRDFENRRVIIPNSLMSKEVLINSNYLDDKVCKFIEIGISYESDIDKAREIMISEIENHSEYLDVRTKEDIKDGVPSVNVRVILLGDSSVVLRGWAWAKDTQTGFFMMTDLYESIKKRFDAEGIVIPFPQRTISFLDKTSTFDSRETPNPGQ